MATRTKRHGARYRTEAIDEDIDWLQGASFEEAKRWYEDCVELMEPQDAAYLACNDRFFLLCFMLGRMDAYDEWLYDRCREVEYSPDWHLDLWAREHYKSTIITFAGSIQEILRDPETTILIMSFNAGIAGNFLRQIKNEFEQNDYLKHCFPDVLWENPRRESHKWSEGEGIVVRRAGNPKEPTVMASGLVDGMPTSMHFNLLIYDDVVVPASVTTPEMVQKTTEMLELSDNLGAGDRRKWYIGTRYSFADTYGVMLERGMAKPRIYPATHNGQMDGEPVFLTRKRWENIKRAQRSTLAAQMLQNPLGGNEQMFNPEHFRYYEVRPSVLNVYIMGDPSQGRSASSDRTAIAVVGIDIHGNKFLLDGLRHRMKLSERWQALKSLHKKWSAEPGVQMLRVGWERYGMQADMEYFEERMRLESYSFSIEELSWPREGDHSKKARVGRLEPDVRIGKFYLPALIYEPGIGPCTWKVEAGRNHIEKTPLPDGKLPRLMQDMILGGKRHMVAKAIRRLDEDRRPYDLTAALIEEMLFFPFAPRDDLVDAVSRIYDMQPMVPSINENRIVDEINDEIGKYEDA